MLHSSVSAAHFRLLHFILLTYVCIMTSANQPLDYEELLDHAQLDNRLVNILHDSPIWNHLLLDEETKENNSLVLEYIPKEHYELSASSVTSSNHNRYENPYTAYLRRVFGSSLDDVDDRQLTMGSVSSPDIGGGKDIGNNDLHESVVHTDKEDVLQTYREQDKQQDGEGKQLVNKQRVIDGEHMSDKQQDLEVYQTDKQLDKERGNQIDKAVKEQHRVGNRLEMAEGQETDKEEESLAFVHNFNLMQRIANLFGIEVVQQNDDLNESKVNDNNKHYWLTGDVKDPSGLEEGVDGHLKIDVEHHEGVVEDNDIKTTTQISVEKRGRTVMTRNQLNTFFRWG